MQTLNSWNRWNERTTTTKLYNKSGDIARYTQSQTADGVLLYFEKQNEQMFYKSENRARKKYSELLSQGWSTKPFIVNYKAWQTLCNQFVVFYQDANGKNVHCEICKNADELQASLIKNLLG